MPILKLLRERQRLGPRATQRKARISAARHRLASRDLKQKIGKLAALVDHYYGAYHEAAKLLARRDRELAEVRRQWRQSHSCCLAADELDLKERLLILGEKARAHTVAPRP